MQLHNPILKPRHRKAIIYDDFGGTVITLRRKIDAIHGNQQSRNTTIEQKTGILSFNIMIVNIRFSV